MTDEYDPKTQNPLADFANRSAALWSNFGPTWWGERRAILFNEFSWVPPADWARVVEWINRHNSMAPRIAKFHEALAGLRIFRPDTGFKCRECGGAKGRRVFLRERATGMRQSCWSPCGVCRPLDPDDADKIQAKARDQAERFEEITEAEYSAPVSEEGRQWGERAAAALAGIKTVDGAPRPIGAYVDDLGF